MHLAKPLLDDALWNEIAPLLPAPKPLRLRFPGRKPVDNRRALTGILFVLRSGIPWKLLPQEMGCGLGMTCWHRLAQWQRAGVWQKLHSVLFVKFHAADQLDWSRAVIDSASVRAVFGGQDRPQPNRSAQSRQ